MTLTFNGRLALAGLAAFALAFGAAACSGDDDDDSGDATTTATSAASPGGGDASGELEITAKDLKFDKDELTVSAGADVELTLNNEEAVPHNFSVYTDDSADEEIFVGDMVTNDTITYNFTAPDEPGEYFFHCDVHPDTMTGTLVVQ